LALSGQAARAQQLADDLEKRFPQNTSVQCSYVPALRGQLALDQGNPSKALGLLQKAVSCETGAPRSAIHANFGAMYPVYVRGEAWLALHKGDQASREFEKMIDHRSVLVSDPVSALAHLGLGRAYAMAGDREKARSAYADFLALWHDADAGIPILIQAKTEQLRLDGAISH